MKTMQLKLIYQNETNTRHLCLFSIIYVKKWAYFCEIWGEEITFLGKMDI